MCHVICEAIDLYHDNKGAYAMLQQRGMTADFSWTRSAQEYRNIYESYLPIKKRKTIYDH